MRPQEAIEPDGGYDAVVSCPPFNVQSESVHLSIGGESVRVNDSLPHQLLLQSCMALNDGGQAVFVLTSSIFTKATQPNGALTHANRLGFDIDAAIELPPGTFRFANIATHLIVVRKTDSQKIFTGRLPSDDVSRNQLLTNYFKRKASPVASLGFLARREGFRGFTPIELERTVKDQAGRMGLEPIPFDQLFDECMLSRPGPDFQPFPEEANTVFLPRMANSPAATSQEQLTPKLRSYFKLVVNPLAADAEFVAELLNTPFGHAWRDSIKTGSGMQAISKSLLQASTFHISPKAMQRSIIACHKQIENTRSELLELSDRLWQEPI